MTPDHLIHTFEPNPYSTPASPPTGTHATDSIPTPAPAPHTTGTPPAAASSPSLPDVSQRPSPGHTLAPPAAAPAPSLPDPTPAPASYTAGTPLSDLTPQPLTWLWPQRIPCGKLTLLDGSPGSGTSLFALTLAACVSSGIAFPDGSACPQGTVILIAPHDSAADTLLPRLQAAGADLTRVLLLTTVVDPSPRAPHHLRPFSLPQDLALLETTITRCQVRLVLIDPFSAVPGLSRALLDLVHLAARTSCAFLLTRSLNQAPADPLHALGPASPVLTAARSRLLLTPDPADPRTHLLLTTKHSLCPPPEMLAYELNTTEQGIPLLHWLGARDPAQLSRLCTGPLRSLHRQAILHFLHHSPTPQRIPDIIAATSYDYEAGRKMVVRMHMAGELVCVARGLYTTCAHPCLAHQTPDPAPLSPPPAGSSQHDSPCTQCDEEPPAVPIVPDTPDALITSSAPPPHVAPDPTPPPTPLLENSTSALPFTTTVPIVSTEIAVSTLEPSIGHDIPPPPNPAHLHSSQIDPTREVSNGHM